MILSCGGLTMKYHNLLNIFIVVFLGGGSGAFRRNREGSIYIETPPLPLKSFTCWRVLGTHGHWAVMNFIVPHQLWHGASVYNGHLRGLLTLTLIAEQFSMDLSLPVFMTIFRRGWDSNTQPSACEANSLTNKL